MVDASSMHPHADDLLLQKAKAVFAEERFWR